MAKGKSGKRGTREALHSLTLALRSRPNQPVTRLTTIEDLRTFDFEPATRPARLFSGSIATVGLDGAGRKKTKSNFQHAQIAFTAPRETLVCVRRSRRKEVLFAKKKTGKRGQRRPRRSKWSSYKC